MKDPKDYDGEPRCMCCGSGWPNCAEVNPATGQKFTHEETCARYYRLRPEDMWLCEECEKFLEETE